MIGSGKIGLGILLRGALWLVGGWLAEAAAEGTLGLVRDGEAVATIVTPEAADVWTRKAAGWLQDYFEKISGARLKIAQETEAVGGPRILIGHTKAAAAAGLEGGDWKWDTCRMAVRGEVLFLVGRDEADVAGVDVEKENKIGAAGTCKAVVSFLEDVCGVRWFLPAPDGERIPHRSTIEVARSLDKTIVPVFAFSHGRDFRGNCDLEGINSPATFANNFRVAIKLHSYGGHSYYTWLPAEKYFKTHPEYFALIHGKRTGAGNHLCSSNPEVRDILIREIRKEFDAGYDWVQLGQEDGYSRCQCERCEALDTFRDHKVPDWYEMYDQAGFERLAKNRCERLLQLHKAIADACRESHPDKTAHLLAYRETLLPSQKFESFGSNVVAELCNINPQAILPWQGKVRGYTAYLYWFDITLRLGMGLHSTPQQAAARIRFLRDWHFLGLYQIPETNWGLQGPVYYVLGKTMGDPDLDPQKLVEEYCAGVFDEAGPEMLAFFNAIYARDIVPIERSSAEYQHLLYYPPSLLNEWEKLLKKAEAKAKSDRAKHWVQLTREHFDYLKRVSGMLVAHENFQLESSPENRAAVLRRVQEFDDYRQHIVEMDDAYTKRWFPGYDKFVNFLTANGEIGVFYMTWAQRRDAVRRKGYRGTRLGYGAALIHRPFTVK
jgi:hypothetical protein